MKTIRISKETIKDLNRVSKAISNAAKEFEKASIALSKFGLPLKVKKPKWYQFWKWEFWQNWENVKPGYSRNQPIIDRTTTPPR